MLEAGTVLGAKYRLDSEIGRGGMGSVWRATRLDLGTELAIKVMEGDASNQASRLERFTREAKAASSLTSPHVVRVFDFGVDAAEGVAFMAMELLEGESLAARVAAGRQSPARVASIITQVARALTQAHAAGIVHRDLKPANVFLVRNDDDELVKLLDFGIAKAGDGASTATGSVLGTPYYMSPEQVGAQKDVDHRTDVWSLGVIACECLTGSRPFAADTLPELAMKIALGRAELPSSLGPVPGGFDEWFARATHVDRSQRFQSASELAGALSAVAARASVTHPPAALALAATLPLDAMDPLPMARPPGRELPATATSVPRDGSKRAALSTTSGGGAAVPTRPRDTRSVHSLRRWLIAAVALGVGGVGVRYAGLLASSGATPAPPEGAAAAAALPHTEPERTALAPAPEALPAPSPASVAPNTVAVVTPEPAKGVARPPVPEPGSSAAGPSRPSTRAAKVKTVRQSLRARAPARDDAQLNAYDLQ